MIILSLTKETITTLALMWIAVAIDGAIQMSRPKLGNIVIRSVVHQAIVSYTKNHKSNINPTSANSFES